MRAIDFPDAVNGGGLYMALSLSGNPGNMAVMLVQQATLVAAQHRYRSLFALPGKIELQHYDGEDL